MISIKYISSRGACIYAPAVEVWGGGLGAAALARSLAVHRLGRHLLAALVGFEGHGLGVGDHDGGAPAALPRPGRRLALVPGGGRAGLGGGGPGVGADLAAGLSQHLQRGLVTRAVLLQHITQSASYRVEVPTKFGKIKRF